MHGRSAGVDVIPLIVLHGWPGTVVELSDLVAPLTALDSDDDPALHVVIPSHPGVGLSGPTPSPAWRVPCTAKAYATLIAELGYDSYVVQGGVHGAVLARHLGRVDHDHVRGILEQVEPGPTTWRRWTTRTTGPAPRRRPRLLADPHGHLGPRRHLRRHGELFADPEHAFADPEHAFADPGVPTAVIAFAKDVSIRRFADRGT